MAHPRVEAARGCGSGGFPQCRQVDSVECRECRQAGDCRLSIHHTAAQPRHGGLQGRPEFRDGGHPGHIEGAHEGRGLGLRFLRHIERNAVLLFLVPGDADDIAEAYRILLDELKKYNPELLEKDRILAISKCDLLDEELRTEVTASLGSLEHHYFSAVTGEGVDRLKDLLWLAIEGGQDGSVSLR